MCTPTPVSELVELPITWLRGDEARIAPLYQALKRQQAISSAITILNCGCGKSYMLQDGGHRITAAYRRFEETGEDVELPVHVLVSAQD